MIKLEIRLICLAMNRSENIFSNAVQIQQEICIGLKGKLGIRVIN
jgi:hypothetical protein